MFDWNDEELENIIWGETGESDDHIVPYPKGNEEKPPGLCGDRIKAEVNQEAASIIPTEQKKRIAKTELHGVKLESNSQCDTNEGIPPDGYGIDSWPALSLSNAAKSDKDSMGAEVSNNLTEIAKYDSSRDRAALADSGSEVFQNQHEDREQGDFVDYGWANIGSFDDLDRIFSNDDSMFGHVSLANADELWSSSNDVTSTQEKSFPLSMDSPNLGSGALNRTTENFEIKTEHMLYPDQSFTPAYEKINHPTSHPQQNGQANMSHIEYTGSESKTLKKEKTDLDMVGDTSEFVNSHLDAVGTSNDFVDKVNRQKKLLKGRKKSVEKSGRRQLEDVCTTCSPSGNQFQQFDGQFQSPMDQICPSPVLHQQRQLQGPESLQYHHFSNTLLAPSMYRNMTNQYPAMPLLPHIHSEEDDRQVVLPGCKISPGKENILKKSPDAAVKPLMMTPQEKIEKLRRRQQMRAMLAIQKQQQQLTHKVSCINNAVTQKSLIENQTQLIEGGTIEVEENLATLPPLDQNSLVEQDDFNTNSMAIDDCSVEDTILYQLQDVIAKLDIRIRLCIRDSLFRLAQSAMQRHYATDTGSTNKSSRDEALTKEEITSHNRMPDVETETNPIDRTIARLLFHRPLDLSRKHPETPESPVSTKPQCERKPISLTSMPMGFFPEGSRNKQNLSHQGSIPCSFAEEDKSKNSPCIDSSENASNSCPADGGAMEVDASH
ncbi:protein LNK2 isoform X2 [Cornus florida]|uniref:protein LNK2 isoform X2 n=1 Tax=Cornus florida TaxID=4283 RepID=UPI00289DE05B|nr:protein LNK2 isoform X2 [Cornus florida]